MNFLQLQEWFEQPHEDKDLWILRLTKKDKDELIEQLRNVNKLESKLKMTEISFEQINNSRNDLIKQLTECEVALEKRIQSVDRR